MATYKRIQGNSLWLDITADANLVLIDPVWDNWTGVWNIVKKVGGVVLASGLLTRSTTTGIFNLRIGPLAAGVTWTALAPGQYVLEIEINNVSVDYRDEKHHTLIITAQGI